MANKMMNHPSNLLSRVCGGTDIPRGTVCVLNAGVQDKSGANAAKYEGIAYEAGEADQAFVVAGPGSEVEALAHDGSISEGDLLVSSSTGRVDTKAANSGLEQNIVGKALRASDAAGQLIPIRVLDFQISKDTGG